MSHTLTLSFTPTTPAPALGYEVAYWGANPSIVTKVAAASSPIIIAGLAETNYTGTVTPVCSLENRGAPTYWTAALVTGANVIADSYNGLDITSVSSNIVAVPTNLPAISPDDGDPRDPVIIGTRSTALLLGDTLYVTINIDPTLGTIFYPEFRVLIYDDTVSTTTNIGHSSILTPGLTYPRVVPVVLTSATPISNILRVAIG